MDAVLTVSMDNMTMKMDMNLDSKESGDQRMSEVGVDMKVSAGSVIGSSICSFSRRRRVITPTHDWGKGQMPTRRGRRNSLRKEHGACLITCNSPLWRQWRCMQKILKR